MRFSTQDWLKELNNAAVIDGSMSTALERLGCQLGDRLWTARCLAEKPELVKTVHLNYFRDGADCGITASYQATIPGLLAAGYSQEEAERIITSAVEIFQKARAQWWEEEGKAQGRVWPLCLGAIGPYGAYLADGSEYRGAYGISDDELYRFHKRRAELIWNAGADVLLFETQPSLKEVLVEARIAEELGADYWISFSCRDGRHICEGDLIRDCAVTLSEGFPHLRMIGVNCTKPEYIRSLIGEIQKGISIPVAVYPNSGEIYDPATKTWHGAADGRPFREYAEIYYESGAAAVGGCCTTCEEHIRQVAEVRDAFLKKPIRKIMS